MNTVAFSSANITSRGAYVQFETRKTTNTKYFHLFLTQEGADNRNTAFIRQTWI